jgi:hypothetical protein
VSGLTIAYDHQAARDLQQQSDARATSAQSDAHQAGVEAQRVKRACMHDEPMAAA